MKNLAVKVLAFLAFDLILLLPAFVSAQVLKDDNGNQFSWDGTYYDFRDAEGAQMVKLWIPPNVKPVKGVLIFGHGGSGGDSRYFSRDKNIRDFAQRLGFGIAGLHNFPGREVYEGGERGIGAKAYFKALELFASMELHPELANVPFAVYGSSNGGAQVYGFVNHAPEKAICFVSNVGSPGSPKIPVNQALKVPGIFIIGKFDALTGESGFLLTSELMSSVLPEGALWSWAIELKGHEDGYSFDVFVKLVEQAVKARYPENANPEKEMVNLKELKREDGWLVDHSSWDNGLVYVDSYQNYKRDKSKAGWCLNEDMAYVYRGLATHFSPLKVTVREFDRSLNIYTDPGTTFSLGGPVTNPGDKLHVTCEMKEFPYFQKLEFFNGADLLGTVYPGCEPTIEITVNDEYLVYCINALATDKFGVQRTGNLMHFFVRDPEKEWWQTKSLKKFSGSRLMAGSKNTGKDIVCTAPDSVDQILVAYGLTPELEKQFSASDGKNSDFWSKMDANHDFIDMTQRRNATENAGFRSVLTHDCRMRVKAAYGSDGMYFLFEVLDDQDVAWPNEYVNTEIEHFYPGFDAVQFFIDSRSVDEIFKAENLGLILSPHAAITTTTRLYQCAMGTDEEAPTGLRRTIPDPWDMNAEYWVFGDVRNYLGIEVEILRTNRFYKTQEWFIPWSELGFDSEPDANALLSFTTGYNDRDEDEHLKPMFTTSGGTNQNSNNIRWIGGGDPYSVPSWEFFRTEGKSLNPPYNWGEIELGAIIK